MTNRAKLSPMMAQWYSCKKEAKDALLLFRLGDFYEAFYDDATLLAKAINVTLTKRQGIPMSGIPAHAAEAYIEKLIEKGFLVAIAEQVEDPKQVKGLVKRKIVKIISPGTILSPLQDKANNFLACIADLNHTLALALLDISTGELRIIELNNEKELQDELFRRHPSEILLSEKAYYPFLEEIQKQLSFRITKQESWRFDYKNCYTFLTRHFKIHTLDGFGLKEKGSAINAIGVLLSYVQEELHLSTSHIKQIICDTLSSYMSIDRTTQRNLELTEPLQPSSSHATLLNLLDTTHTPMGSRLFKNWLMHPLLSTKEIIKRQDAIEELQKHLSLSNTLKQIRDLERLIMRITMGNATPRDLTDLRYSLEKVPLLTQTLSPLHSAYIQSLKKDLFDPSAISKKIAKTLVDDPPLKWGEGKIIRCNINTELDTLRSLKTDSQSWIAKYQAKLKECTGIKNLKIIFSKGFGYCIEVSRGQSDKVPISFQRRQTLVNNERFISPELKEYEEKILTAEEKIQSIELHLYQCLRKEIATYIESIKTIAHAIATLDVLLSLAQTAIKNHYCRPTVNDSNILNIQTGRHPIIEHFLCENPFIPNDITFEQQHFLLITGPNMSGKSTYIRQIALIVIMAQIGSFVPAKSATIGIVDKVFSRIGANDDLSRGQSTFMVEMAETANILHNTTARSLVILDEIGRGTSTYDGISIAWSVAEYLMQIGCKTLFATHYFELTQLKGVKNISVAVQESKDKILFLRKIIDGSTDKSYGIHVARLAGLPHPVLTRAYEILHKLESKSPISDKLCKHKAQNRMEHSSTPPSKNHPKIGAMIQDLQEIDLNQITPFTALKKVFEWQEKIKNLSEPV